MLISYPISLNDLPDSGPENDCEKRTNTISRYSKTIRNENVYKCNKTYQKHTSFLELCEAMNSVTHDHVFEHSLVHVQRWACFFPKDPPEDKESEWARGYGRQTIVDCNEKLR